jgi:type 1 glutamine amidotransferase/nicotinamidase-related amidase
MKPAMRSFPRLWCLAILAFAVSPALVPSGRAAEFLELPARSRARATGDTNRWEILDQTLRWSAKHTALVICDMWDHHWCAGATRRVAEMAPRLNQFVRAARELGALVIHCPSDTMHFYDGSASRDLAKSAPVFTPVVPLERWCRLDPTREAPLPIDDADGGCDDDPSCKSGPPHPWTRQIATIDVLPGDAVTDSAEAFNLMRARGITNVLVTGVHLNMCVLGRPFSICQMVRQGQNVLLVRDLTDTMYNSRRRPFVPHAIGTELMIEHVEKYWCPSITSAALLGGEAFRFAEDRRPRIVLFLGEDEYKTAQTLPAFARNELEWRGFRVTAVEPDAGDKNNFPGLVAALKDADLVLLSVRRRALPKDQLDAFRAYLDAGKPLVGIRTASHAFAPRGADAEKGAAWPEFDAEVLAGNYHNHHGVGARTTMMVLGGADTHPLLTGVELRNWTSGASLYLNMPLKPGAAPLLFGAIPEKPPEPVAWTHAYGAKRARVFYTSLGAQEDFESRPFRRLLLNGILWALDWSVYAIPPADLANAK